MEHESEGIRWIVSRRDENYILNGSGVVIEYTDSAFGKGFTVARANAFNSCC